MLRLAWTLISSLVFPATSALGSGPLLDNARSVTSLSWTSWWTFLPPPQVLTPSYFSESSELILNFIFYLVPYVFSISYQDYENTVTPEYAQRVSIEFMKGNARGLTFVTGSGDWGVGCTNNPAEDLQVNCNVFTADFPSSSPYLTSLGTFFRVRFVLKNYSFVTRAY